MSALETYNEKLLAYNKVQRELDDLTITQNRLNDRLSKIAIRITTKTEAKVAADLVCDTAKNNVPEDMDTYKDALLACEKINKQLNIMGNNQTRMTENLSEVTREIAEITVEVNDAQAELTIAQNAL